MVHGAAARDRKKGFCLFAHQTSLVPMDFSHEWWDSSPQPNAQQEPEMWVHRILHRLSQESLNFGQFPPKFESWHAHSHDNKCIESHDLGQGGRYSERYADIISPPPRHPGRPSAVNSLSCAANSL